jgi:hypothetical protein
MEDQEEKQKFELRDHTFSHSSRVLRTIYLGWL